MSVLHNEAIMERARENYDPDDGKKKWQVSVSIELERSYTVYAHDEENAVNLAINEAEEQYRHGSYYAYAEEAA